MTRVISFLDSRNSLPLPDVDGVHSPYPTSVNPRTIPELYDIPIGIVNRVLYHEAHRRATTRQDDNGRR